MPTDGLTTALKARLDEMARAGRLKGSESVIRAVVPARAGRGPRYLLEGEGDREFLRIYKHLDMDELERNLAAAAKSCARAIVITDGIFSMRGDHAPLDRVMAIAHVLDKAFAENIIVVVDDSHGVGAFGATGRGTEEY